MALRATAIWLVIIVIESIHGTLRAFLLAPRIGDFLSRQIGVLTGSLLILAVSLLLLPWLKVATARGLVGVGLWWVLLTVGFEMVLGRLLLNLPWSRLLQDYDLKQGGLLGTGLIFMVFAPLMSARLLRKTPV